MDENTKYTISEYREELYYGRRRRLSTLGVSVNSRVKKSKEG